MIILSGVLVVLAIALLITGIVTGYLGHEVVGLDGLKLTYVSIGVSIVSALFLAIGVFIRRKELFGTAASPTTPRASVSKAGARPVKAKARVGAENESPVVPAPSATATDVPAETTVYVVPGRKRYHLQTCRQVAGRDTDELTFVEAREEGFTACTACLPDTALAARAALGDVEPAQGRAPDAEIDRPESATAPVEVTRTDIPVTRALPPGRPSSADEREAVAEKTPATTTGESTGDERTTGEDTAREDGTREVATAGTAEPPAAPAGRPRSRSLFEPLQRAEARTSAPETVPAGDPDTDRRQPGEDAVSERDGTDPLADAPLERRDTRSDAARTVSDPETADPETPSETAEPGIVADHEEGRDEGDDGAEADDARATATDDADAADTTDAADTDTDPAAPDTVEPEDAEATREPEPSDEPAGDGRAEHDTTVEDAGEAVDDATEPTVRVLSGTKRYHRQDCALIEDIADDADDLESMPRPEAKERGCTPCLVCRPDDDTAD